MAGTACRSTLRSYQKTSWVGAQLHPVTDFQQSLRCDTALTLPRTLPLTLLLPTPPNPNPHPNPTAGYPSL
jgi:hypothetical protein